MQAAVQRESFCRCAQHLRVSRCLRPPQPPRVTGCVLPSPLPHTHTQHLPSQAVRKIGFIVYALGKPLDPFLQKTY